MAQIAALSTSAAPSSSYAQTLAQASAAARLPGGTVEQRAAVAAKDFEGVFLNSMFQQMFTGIDGDGPFGGGAGGGVWRSFLADEYAKSFAKAGGIGIGTEVYRTLLAQQEAKKP